MTAPTLDAPALEALRCILSNDLSPTGWRVVPLTVPRRPRHDDLTVLVAQRPGGAMDDTALWFENNRAHTGLVVHGPAPRLVSPHLTHIDVNAARKWFVSAVRQRPVHRREVAA